MKMPNGNLFSGIAGGLEGVSRYDPFGRGSQFAKGITATPIEKLWTAAEREGASLSAIRKDLIEFGKYDIKDGRYLIESFYSNRPKAAEFMNAVLEDYLNPPGFAKMSPAEKEEYNTGQVDMILNLIKTTAARGEVVPERTWAGMKRPLEEKYIGEGALKERYMPWGFEEKPELKRALFKGVTGREEAPMTGAEMAEARRLGKKLGEYSISYQEFQDNRGTLFRELTGTELQKSVVAMVVKGVEAAVMEPGWWIKKAGEKETAEEAEARILVEKRHPFLKDKNAAKFLKVAAITEEEDKERAGLIDWTKFSSANIEAASDEIKMDAWTYLLQYGGFESDQMWFIFHDWFPGPGTAEEPPKWGGLGGETLGG